MHAHSHALLTAALGHLVDYPTMLLVTAVTRVCSDDVTRHEVLADAADAGLPADGSGPDLVEALTQALTLHGPTEVPPPPASHERPVLLSERRVAILMAEALDAQARSQALMQQAHDLAQEECGVSFREMVARSWAYTSTALRNLQATAPVVERAAGTVERGQVAS